MLINRDIRFIFLHLPVPHPPGNYNRNGHRFNSGGTYLDNLALADETLRILIKEFNESSSANQTILLISSDHSWRTPLWRHSEQWSDEEERASGDRFDDRPVLLIHFPCQKDPIDIGARVTELVEHDILADMLNGRVRNAQEVVGSSRCIIVDDVAKFDSVLNLGDLVAV